MCGSGSGMRKWSDPDMVYNILDPQHWPVQIILDVTEIKAPLFFYE
jgi:hypothetical protein